MDVVLRHDSLGFRSVPVYGIEFVDFRLCGKRTETMNGLSELSVRGRGDGLECDFTIMGSVVRQRYRPPAELQ